MSEEVKRRVAGVFDRAAATYDDVGVAYFSVFGRALVEAADLRPGDRVLDVGCGRGACLWPAAAAVGPTGAVVGIDLAPGMVAATAAQARAVPQVVVAHADAERPPAAARAYDVVLSGMSVFFLPDPAGALARWRDCLRPGGRLAVSTFAGDDERWGPVADVFADFATSPDARPSRGGGARPWDTDEGMAALLAGAGFDDVRSTTSAHAAVFPDAATWLAWTRSHGQRAAWERIPDDDVPAAEAALREALGPLRDPDGAWRLHVQVRCTVAVRPRAAS